MLDPDANRLGMSLTGSYPVKISAIKNLETFLRYYQIIISDTEKGSISTSRLSYHRSFSSFKERERKWYKSKECTH